MTAKEFLKKWNERGILFTENGAVALEEPLSEAEKNEIEKDAENIVVE